MLFRSREAAMGGHMLPRPGQVIRDVAGEEEQAAGRQQAVDVAEGLRPDEAALVVARLGPRVRIEKIDALERGVGQSLQQRSGIAVMDISSRGSAPALMIRHRFGLASRFSTILAKLPSLRIVRREITSPT